MNKCLWSYHKRTNQSVLKRRYFKIISWQYYSFWQTIFEWILNFGELATRCYDTWTLTIYIYIDSHTVTHILDAKKKNSHWLHVGSNGFGGLSTVPSTMPDFGVGISSPLAMVSPSSTRPTTTALVTPSGFDNRSIERSIVLELALAAMDELVKMAQTDEPLWIRSLEGGREILNHDEYTRTITPCIGLRPNGFVTEASRQTGMVIINSLALVETLMDSVSLSTTFHTFSTIFFLPNLFPFIILGSFRLCYFLILCWYIFLN